VTDEIEQLSCQEVVELVTDYLEDALDADDRDELERHLATCDGCREFLEQLRKTIALAGAPRPRNLPPETEEALFRAFRSRKSD
jgi:anti-sigma factor RsiW